MTFNTALSDSWIWILLTRHVVDTRETSDYISLRVELEEGMPMITERVSEQTLAKEVSNEHPAVDFAELADVGNVYEWYSCSGETFSRIPFFLISITTGQITGSERRRCFFDYRVS
jgi:hypothetical protein